MSWVKEENNGGSGKLKPSWEYRKGVECVTVLPNESRVFALISGDLDPTKTWDGPVTAWIHQFKGQSGFQTIVCNKWNEACVCCFENEIYKSANPNYKQTGGKLPMGLSKKAIIQVWDPTLQKVLWLIAGKQIIEGMDFIMTRQAELYKGFVTITRSGEGFNTSYRVDLAQPFEIDMNMVSQQTIGTGEFEQTFILSNEEVQTKVGQHPTTYFQSKLSQYPNIDISGWGPVPREISVAQSPAQNPAISNPPTAPNPAVATPLADSVAGQNAEITEIAKAGLEVVCTQGIYVNQRLVEVIRQTGKPYIQYLLRAGSKEESEAAKVLLDEWDAVNLYIRGEAF